VEKFEVARTFFEFFNDAPKAREMADLAVEIQRTDSHRRNLADQLQRYEQQLQEDSEASTIAGDIQSRVGEFRERIATHEDQLTILNDQVDQLEQDRRQSQQKLEAIRLLEGSETALPARFARLLPVPLILTERYGIVRHQMFVDRLRVLSI
jgi:hypothetical protein